MKLNILKLKPQPAFTMLRLEEALLRSSEDLWVCMTPATTHKQIILGSSGKIPEWINTEAYQEIQRLGVGVPEIVRRFTGGGTVLVREGGDSFFVSFIGHANWLKEDGYAPYPQPVMEWTEEIWKPVFGTQFKMMQNDYVFDEQLKFAGNAQYFTGGLSQRFCHHTTFLWNYDQKEMETLLALPVVKRRPKYRADRKHSEFLVPMKDAFVHLESPDHVLDILEDRVIQLAVKKWSGIISEVELVNEEDVLHYVEKHHLKRNFLIDIDGNKLIPEY